MQGMCVIACPCNSSRHIRLLPDWGNKRFSGRHGSAMFILVDELERTNSNIRIIIKSVIADQSG